MSYNELEIKRIKRYRKMNKYFVRRRLQQGLYEKKKQ
jgi:hypothetical protein